MTVLCWALMHQGVCVSRHSHCVCLCVCMCMCVQEHVRPHVCEGQRTSLGVFPHGSSTLWFEAGYLIGLELT